MQMRILITGYPKCGKTTLSEQFNSVPAHTDDLKELDWSEQSEKVSEWFDEESPWVIEGN